MSKIKKLEQEIQELKTLVLQLQSQVLALQSRFVAAVPITVPNVQLNIVPAPSWPPYTPYIGDPPGWQGSPTITCGSKTEISGCSNQQDSRCC